MRLAFRTHDLGVRGLDGAIAKAESYGISALQLVAYKFMDEIKYAPGQLNERNSAAIGAALKSAGIEVGLIGAYFNPVHSDKQKVANCIEVFKEYLRYSKNLGCGIVGSETGSFNDDKWTYNPKNRTYEALETVVGIFKDLAHYAKSVGACVGIEGAAGHVCYNVATLKRAVDMINCDNVRVIFDLYNYLDESNCKDYLDILDEGLKTFKGQIAVFHIKDCIFTDGKPEQVAPGKGMLDFGKILSAIKAYDKDALLVLEGTTGEDAVPAIKFIESKWESV